MIHYIIPMSSCERSELCNTSETYQWTVNSHDVDKYDTATAVTIKLNTAPWKPNGIASEEIIAEFLNIIRQSVYGVIFYPFAWELDKNCQLHVHATIFSNFTIYRNKVINKCKAINDKYQIYIKEIETKEEVKYWMQYCRKCPDMRRLYYEKIAFCYQDANKEQCMLDCQDELADIFIELDKSDTNTWKWRNKQFEKPWFIDE